MELRTWLGRLQVIHLIAGLLILGGLWLRFEDLGFPPKIAWDEHHFVINARNYLAGKPDWNDHPPLGKFFIAASIHCLGDTAFAFRLPTVLFGIGSMLAGGLIARRLFPFRAAGLLAAAMFAIDGFFIAYSRAALLDGVLTCFALFSFFFALQARNFWSIAVASIFAALAVSTKTSGVLCMVPIIYFCVQRKKYFWLLSLALVPVIFYAQWAYGLYLTGKPYDVASAWQVQADLMRHHAGLTQMTHPLTSRWFTWLVPLRTLPMRHDMAPEGAVRIMNSMGHPLLWWTTSLLVIVGSARLALKGLVAELAQDSKAALARRSFLANHQSIAELLLMWWLFMAPWVLTRRDSYVYHYLPCYAFGLILTAGALAWLCETRRKLGFIALSSIAAVAVFYAPVWGQLPIDPQHIKWRLFLQGWR